MRDRGGMVASWLALTSGVLLAASPVAASAAGSVAPSGPASASASRPASAVGERRPDLIGRHYAGPAAPESLDPNRVVPVIVEFAGDTVADRLTRLPSTAPQAAEQVLRIEQRGFDRGLRSSGFTVTGRMVHALNGVTGRVRVRDLDALRRLPGVVDVEVAGTVRRDNALATAASGAATAWQDLGLTGAGITIGVIDDGIDYTHADFGGSGNPDDYSTDNHAAIEVGSFPTAKVVGGYDFAGDAYDADDPEQTNSVPVPDADPIACGLHGTHVAGTAAGQGVVSPSGAPYTGPYDAATLAGVTFSVAPGAAPQAKLRAYKVFGCTGTADDAVILQAIDKAVADKVDVINLSLGESLGTGNAKKILVKAVNRASSRGTLVVASAGNQGAAPYLVGSPATADTALAVAAMDAGPSTWPGVDLDPLGISGVDTGETAVTSDITGPVKVVAGCEDLAYQGASGTILVVRQSDGCVENVFDHLAGVLAVVVITDEYFRAGYLDAAVPFVLVLDTDASPLLAADTSTITLSPGASVADPEHGGFAGFTSAGPRRDDQVMKPDVTAPGVSLSSALRGSGTGAAELSGTSMAAPLTSGIAALVNQAHPTWTPAQIKAAIMSTADPSGVSDLDPLRGGTGLVAAERAAATVALITTTDGRHNLSFGFNALTTSYLKTKTFKISNTSASPITYTFTTEFHGPTLGATVTMTPSSVTVRGKSSKTITVKMKLDKAQIPALPGALESAEEHLVAIDGFVVATPTVPSATVFPLRIAFSMLPKGLSNVTAPTRVSALGGAGSVKVTNSGRHAGTADVFQWILHDRVGDSPNAEIGDLVDLGVKSFPYDPLTETETGPDRQVVFAMNTTKAASTHVGQEYAVLIDVDDDLTFDYLVVAGDEGISLGEGPNGHFVTFTVDFVSLDIVDAYVTEAPLNGSVVYLRTTASSLGTAAGSVAWNLFADSTSRIIDDIVFDDIPDVGWAVYQPFHPFLVGGGSSPIPLAPGTNTVVGFTVDGSQFFQTHKGLLIVSPDDAAGVKTANTVTVTGL